MFDDCNTFFKGKPDGRVAASTAVAGAARPGGALRPAAAAGGRPTAQYLHSRKDGVASGTKTTGKGAKVRGRQPRGWRIAATAGGSSRTENEKIGVW